MQEIFSIKLQTLIIHRYWWTEFEFGLTVNIVLSSFWLFHNIDKDYFVSHIKLSLQYTSPSDRYNAFFIQYKRTWAALTQTKFAWPLQMSCLDSFTSYFTNICSIVFEIKDTERHAIFNGRLCKALCVRNANKLPIVSPYELTHVRDHSLSGRRKAFALLGLPRRTLAVGYRRFVNLEDGTDRLSRNVLNQLPTRSCNIPEEKHVFITRSMEMQLACLRRKAVP
jgi:hypothetical protein